MVCRLRGCAPWQGWYVALGMTTRLEKNERGRSAGVACGGKATLNDESLASHTISDRAWRGASLLQAVAQTQSLNRSCCWKKGGRGIAPHHFHVFLILSHLHDVDSYRIPYCEINKLNVKDKNKKRPKCAYLPCGSTSSFLGLADWIPIEK